MIAHLRGRLISKHPNQAVVEAGGVGYDVTISVPTFSELPGTGGEVALHIHTHVREDSIALFGFLYLLPTAAQQADYSKLKSDAEQFYASGSYARANEVYSKKVVITR